MPDSQNPSVGFLQRHHLLLRRLHSLTGIVPIGAFLIFHLTTNASIVWGMLDAREGASAVERGVNTFQGEVGFIHSLPFLLLIEIFGLWLPIAFHAGLGLVYAFTGRPNVGAYAYMSNRRYTLQRISGYVGILFIFYHVATLRWGWTWLPLSSGFNGEAAASTTARALRGGTDQIGAASIAVALFYLASVSLLVYHFANGLWTAAITWGLTISKGAQRRWGYVCTAFGAAMMLMAWSAVIGFVALGPARAEQAEAGSLDQQPSQIDLAGD